MPNASPASGDGEPAGQASPPSVKAWATAKDCTPEAGQGLGRGLGGAGGGLVEVHGLPMPACATPNHATPNDLHTLLGIRQGAGRRRRQGAGGAITSQLSRHTPPPGHWQAQGPQA